MAHPSLRFVDHTYRDYSRYIEEGGQLIKHKKCDRNFPSKVHQMLENEEHSHVITWMPHGRAFKVLDKDLLISDVIPNYFICRKYESFTRQLNGWGFKRLYQSGPDNGCYYHECFLRGLPKLTPMVRRLQGIQGKATPYPAGEPNFYSISEIYPVPPRGGAPPSNESNSNSAPSPAAADAASGALPPAVHAAGSSNGPPELQQNPAGLAAFLHGRQLANDSLLGGALQYQMPNQPQQDFTVGGMAQHGMPGMPYNLHQLSGLGMAANNPAALDFLSQYSGNQFAMQGQPRFFQAHPQMQGLLPQHQYYQALANQYQFDYAPQAAQPPQQLEYAALGGNAPSISNSQVPQLPNANGENSGADPFMPIPLAMSKSETSPGENDGSTEQPASEEN